MDKLRDNVNSYFEISALMGDRERMCVKYCYPTHKIS